MAKYRKKPVIVEAVQWEPNSEIHDGYEMRDSLTNQIVGFCSKEDRYANILSKTHPIIFTPAIKTLEGWHVLSPGDYIITGVRGERYPCKPDVFHKTYELVEE